MHQDFTSAPPVGCSLFLSLLCIPSLSATGHGDLRTLGYLEYSAGTPGEQTHWIKYHSVSQGRIWTHLKKKLLKVLKTNCDCDYFFLHFLVCSNTLFTHKVLNYCVWRDKSGLSLGNEIPQFFNITRILPVYVSLDKILQQDHDPKHLQKCVKILSSREKSRKLSCRDQFQQEPSGVPPESYFQKLLGRM